MHAALQRLRFGARTVPGMTLESGEKLVGSRAIMRRLEELAPEPSLLPGRPRRARRGRARRGVGRRGLAADGPAPGVGDAHAAARAPWSSYQDGSRCPLPRPPCCALAPVVIAVERRLNGADEGAVRADLRALPGHLDRIDGWIADGVLGGETVNAADLQIATTLAADADDRRRAPVLRRAPGRGARDGAVRRVGRLHPAGRVPGGVAVGSSPRERRFSAQRLRPPAAPRPRARTRG